MKAVTTSVRENVAQETFTDSGVGGRRELLDFLNHLRQTRATILHLLVQAVAATGVFRQQIWLGVKRVYLGLELRDALFERLLFGRKLHQLIGIRGQLTGI